MNQKGFTMLEMVLVLAIITLLVTNDEGTAPERNNAFNHLVDNNPNVDGVYSALDYPKTGSRRWKGPYLSRLGPDPWGNAYIISVGVMEANGQPIATDAKGWILSAGPNGVIETAPDSSVLGGRDVGLILSDSGFTSVVP